MEADGTQDDLRDQALASLKRKRDFRNQVAMWALMSAFFVAIWAVTSDAEGFFWPIFPIAGWGIGLTADAWATYGEKPISDAEIDREVEKLR